MTLTSREKKTLVVGAIIAALVLLIAYVLVPVGRAWVQLGSVLGPKLQYVQRVQERAQEQNALLARREVLVGRLGSVLGPEAAPPEEKSEKPKARAARPAGTERKPATEEESSKRLETPSEVKPTGSKESPDKSEAGPEKPDKPKMPQDKPKTEEAKPAKPAAPKSGISLAAHLERIAKKSGIKINKVTPRKPSACWKGNRYFKAVGLQVGFQTKIQSLIKLLHALEKGERLVRVEQVGFSRDLKKGQNIRVSLQVVGYESVAR